MATKKQNTGYGCVIRKKGRNKLYIKLTMPMRERLAGVGEPPLPENIATGCEDTKQGWKQAEEMLAELNRKYDRLRGLMPAEPVNYYAPENRSLTIQEAINAFTEDYLANKEFKTRERFGLSFRSVIPEEELNLPIDREYKEGQNLTLLYLEKIISNYITHGSKNPRARRIVTKSGDTGKTQELNPHSGRTIQDYVTNMHTFCQWCHDYGHIRAQPRWNILRKKIPNWTGKTIKIYTRSEMDAFIRYNKEIADGERLPYRKVPISTMDSAQKRFESVLPKIQQERLRFYYLLRMFDLIPFRIHETFEVTKSDIDFKSRRLRLTRKDHKKIEYFPITNRIRDLFEEMFEVLKVKDKLLPYTPTNYMMLKELLINTMEGTDIERDGRLFHEFKKKFITELILKTGSKNINLLLIAQLARCGIEVIQKHYLQVTNLDLLEVLDQTYDEKEDLELLDILHKEAA